MSKLDPNSESEPKAVVQMGPTPEEVLEAEVPSGTQSQKQGPIKTAASYGERVKQRHAATAAVKKGSGSVGQAPPLDSEKMNELADRLAPQPDFGDDEDEDLAPARAPVEPPAAMAGGVGAAYQVNQAIAAGETDGPVSMREAKKIEAKVGKGSRKSLSPESVAQLEAAAAAAEGESPSFSPGEDTTSDDLEEAVRDAVAPRRNIDASVFDAQRRILMDSRRKEAIEEKLEELDLSDMITKREIQQKVIIQPGKLSYTFRTYNQHENLFCLGYVYDHPGSALQADELLNTCKLTCCLVKLNSASLPEHRRFPGTTKEEVDKEAFDKKFQLVASFPTQMLADMSVNAVWFEERVNQLFSLDHLKNG